MKTELFYHQDSYLTTFTSPVVAIQGAAFALAATAFYPGGGGQMADRGTVEWGGQTYPLTEVRKEGDVVWHVARGSLPAIGSPVTGTIDWEFRYQMMRTHTALHILCGTIWREFGVQVTGGQMYPDRARMDFAMERFDSSTVALIEQKINEAVQADYPVRVQVLPRQDAFAIPDLIRTKINLLPEDITEVRTVEIVGLDLQADGGTHVHSTHEVGGIKILKTENKGKINKRLEIAVVDAPPAQAEPLPRPEAEREAAHQEEGKEQPELARSARHALTVEPPPPSASGAVSTLFQPVPVKPDFPALERERMAWWTAQGTMRKYLERNKDSAQRFSFIDGPITANNPMGVHHAWGRTYKDLIQRYKTMQGFKQRYQNGFDCQGLWVEVEVEKELGFNSKRDIETFGIGPFVERCKERVRKFSRVQTEQSIRLGYWMDWDNSYFTMSDENNYTIWHFLKTCHERGWLYRGQDVMPWCPRCGTGLSNMEIATEGYQELAHTSVFVKLPLVDKPDSSLLVWTTTPWTLPANVAAAVHPELNYVMAVYGKEVYYLAEGAQKMLKTPPDEIHGSVPGSSLLGMRYTGPFDDLPAAQGVHHTIIPWSEVGATEGTGIVHIAPGCGKEDYALSREHGLDVLAPIDDFGVYVEGYNWLSGKSVTEVNDAIFAHLESQGMLYRTEKYRHRYPVCWRCGTELVFRLVKEWFISMAELRHQITEVVRQITWIPDFGLERELDWLRNMDDWMISKKRYWGLALPIYDCKQCGTFEVIGGDEELKARAVEGWAEFAGHTPHRPWIDAVKIKCRTCGELVTRIPDVGNPWLDAGIVPFSTLDYRHDRAYWQEWFPADFITESFPGQFRNWFYSLLTMSTALENKPPFLTVLGYALVRDEKGQEMHKSKGNAIWFEEAADKMGVDTMRWIFAGQNPSLNLNFGYTRGEEVRKQFILTLWNVYSFFVIYATIDGFDPVKNKDRVPVSERHPLDRWITSELHELIGEVTRSLDRYDIATPVRVIETFVDNLSNWYVRRGRRRYWKSEEDTDKVAAYLTLYEVLVTLTKLLAPFMPWIAEELYQNLVRSVQPDAPESVHLAGWPVVVPGLIDKDLETETRLVLRVVNLGRAARARSAVKVRQPLAEMAVRVRSPQEEASLERLQDQVLDELNIKQLTFLGEESDLLSYRVNLKVNLLGPKYGARLPELLAAAKQLDPREAGRALREQRQVVVPLSGGPVTLEEGEIEIIASAREGYSAVEEKGYLAAIKTDLTPELLEEGLVRDLSHHIQELRKKAGFKIEEKISTRIQTNPELAAIIKRYEPYLKQETLSAEWLVGTDAAPDSEEHLKLGPHELAISLKNSRY